jgi:long-subunit acyl-CoA synthetase (AMP-forming)
MYHNNPEANANAFDQDGFFHTGDLFQVNEKGNFTHIDRLNDVIKYKYYKVR